VHINISTHIPRVPSFLLHIRAFKGACGVRHPILSQREAIDTEGPLARAIIVIVSAMAELERCIII